MNHPFSNRKKATIAIALIAIIAASTGIYLQNNPTTQAALINPHPGLVGWWSFEEGTGTVVGDSSNYGNNGTSFGTAHVVGKYGDGNQFSGSSSYVQIPDSVSLSPTSEAAIEAWIYPTSSAGQDFKRIVCKSTGVDTGEYTLWLYNSRQIIWYVNNWAHGYIISSTIPLNEWTHVVGVYNGTLTSNRLKLYINGVLNAQGATTDNQIVRTASNLFVGDRGGADRGFIGVIDEVQVYNRALSLAEIQSMFQESPDLSSRIAVKIPQGTTQIITTLSWQGTGGINATILSPSQSYSENAIPVYQKTSYSTLSGAANMLNIKRLSVSVSPISTDQDWYIELKFDRVDEYQASIEIQK
jgi:hypothetical protein